MPTRPRDVYHAIMSVPHSGTRTLQLHLAQERRQLNPPGKDMLGVWHFNFHPHLIAKFFLYANESTTTRRGYIPIRNPIDVADSWQRRYGDNWQHSPELMLQHFQIMLDHIQKQPDHIELFKIEDLPVLRGHGPQPEGWEKIGAAAPRAAVLRDWINGNPEVESFYRGMYTAEELWWL